MTAVGHNLTVSDLTDRQLMELHVFAAYSIVGAVRGLIADGVITDDATLHLLDRYDAYGAELKSRRTQED